MNCIQRRTGDFLRTITDARDDTQLFWEAFPAEGGTARTTYMFTYTDCHRSRPSLQVTAKVLQAPLCYVCVYIWVGEDEI